MKREKLLRSKDYILSKLQLNLLDMIGQYKEKKKLKDAHLAKELGVSKGYVSQILHATYDHKLSKVVELALACNKMPLLHFVDLDQFIKLDANDKIYELVPVQRPMNIIYEDTSASINSSEYAKVNINDLLKLAKLTNQEKQLTVSKTEPLLA